ncbi:MAG: glycosyltransferase family A protein [Fuerstiella sp.]
MMADCSHLEDRLRPICEGTAPLPLAKINVYREHWGLPALNETADTDVERPDVVIHDGKAIVPHNVPTAAPTRVIGPRVGGCGCRVTKPPQPAGPGTELLSIFKGAGVPGCQQCAELAKRMDAWGAAGCREHLAEIVEDMLPRAVAWIEADAPWVKSLLPEVTEAVADSLPGPRRVTSMASRIGARLVASNCLSPALQTAAVGTALRVIVTRAIDTAETKERRRQELRQRVFQAKVTSSRVRWTETALPMVRIVPAVRTAFRPQPTLDRTVQSLNTGGFERPLIFCEPDAPPHADEFVRWPAQLKPFRSFVAMCESLLQQYPADWYLLCEDDVELQVGVADRLRELPLNPTQILTLYLSRNQQRQAEIDDGFVQVSGDVHGSLAYLVHATAVRQLLDSSTFKTWDLPDRVDRAVSKAVSEEQLQLVTHTPALAQHIGATSTINPGRGLNASRTSTFQSARHESPLLSLITPTGDRPEAFSHCEHWMQRQRYIGPVQWIVVDDGRNPTTCTMGQKYLRERPMSRHSLCRNLQTAIPHVQGERILIIEDDDYYGPDYLSVMSALLSRADLVGEFGAKYYYIDRRMWRHHVDREHHASLCRTGMTRAVLPLLQSVTTNTVHPSVDLRLWEQWDGSTLAWRDRAGTSRMCVGIKGGPGRSSRGHRPAATAQADDGLQQLKRWLGPDWVSYQHLIPGSAPNPNAQHGTSMTSPASRTEK